MASPKPGVTVQGQVTPWLQVLISARDAMSQTARSDGAAREAARQWGAPPDISTLDAPVWLADTALSVWLVYRAATGSTAGPDTALRWFGGPPLKTDHAPMGVLDATSTLPIGHRLSELLPYLLEAFGEHMPSAVGRSAARYARRPTGTYLTPTDVAEFTVRIALDKLPPGALSAARVIDPAVGTGVFLLAAGRLIARRTARPLEDVVTSQLFGIDRSAAAIRAAAFALTETVAKDARRPPHETWRAMFSRLRHADTTTLLPLGAEGGLDDLFPTVSGGFEAVVGNPPFAALPRDRHVALRRRLFESLRHRAHRAPAYLPFVEMSWLLSARKEAVAGLVLPLSVAANRDTAHKRLRSAIAATDADWDFLSFDRTPDSLFGDDVKTRNTVLVMRRRSEHEQGKPVIRTTGLRRWSIGSRDSALLAARRDPVDIGQTPIDTFVPKLGSKVEVQAYSALRSQARLRETMAGQAGVECVAVASTAYNWLSIRRSHGPQVDGGRAGTTLRFADSDTADAAYAVLMSRLTYWLWRVEGDGFHVTATFLRETRFRVACEVPARSSLAALGRALWADVQRNPVRAVNAGVETLSFSPDQSTEMIAAIDEALCGLLRLPEGFSAYLRDYHRSLVSAGRPERPMPVVNGGQSL